MDLYPERFYTRFGALFGWFAVVAGPIWTVTLVAPNPGVWDAPLALGVSALLLVLCAICAAFVAALYPVRIGAVGLRSYDLWGRYHSVPWSMVERAEPRKYLGFPFLRIVSGSGQVVYVTLWLRRREAFVSRAEEHAGAKNPLIRALKAG